MTTETKAAPARFLQIAVLFEGGLFVVALTIGWLLGFDVWYGISGETYDAIALSRELLWGVAATGPAVVLLMLEDSRLWRPLRDLKTEVSELLEQMLAGARLWQLLVVATLAGLGEEIFFRGLIQHGLSYLLPGTWGLIASLLIASLLFGLCHYLSHTYFVMAALAGVYFGLVMLLSGSILPAMIAHALYDYIALAYFLYADEETSVASDGPR